MPIGWQDVKGGLLQISKSVEYKSDCNQPTLKDTKTTAGVRFVPLPDELAAMLDKKSRYFFHRKDGRMLTATGLRRMWASFHRACDRAAGAAGAALAFQIAHQRRKPRVGVHIRYPLDMSDPFRAVLRLACGGFSVEQFSQPLHLVFQLVQLFFEISFHNNAPFFAISEIRKCIIS